jgi:hypothetical protein
MKEAGPLSWFMKLIGRGAKAAPKARGAAKATAGAAAKTTRPRPSAATNVSVKPPRKKPAPKPQAPAAPEQPPQNTGLLSNIPWWGKALGAGALGYGAYRMMSPSEPEPQGIQPYFGPGNAAVDQRGMYPGF